MNPFRLFRSASPGMLAALAAALILGATGCDSIPSGSTGPSWIALQQLNGGDPLAPAYTVTLFDDGRVIFEGHSGVKRQGTVGKTIPPEKAAAVFKRLELIDFWTREPRYDVDRVQSGGDSIIARVAPPDAPSEVLSARHAGRFKRIDGLHFAPHELIDLRNWLQEVVGLAEWVTLPAPESERRR